MAVLVVYASPLGSTREIAQHVASRMAVALGEVECRPVGEVEAVAGYGAVVVGSAIRNQAWLPSALSFLTRHATELANVPVWAFSVGMAEALPKPIRRRGAVFQEQRLETVLSEQIALRGHKAFSGVFSASQMPVPLRILFRLVGGRFGDFRDWAAVDAWTDQITAQLAKPASSTPPGRLSGPARSSSGS